MKQAPDSQCCTAQFLEKSLGLIQVGWFDIMSDQQHSVIAVFRTTSPLNILSMFQYYVPASRIIGLLCFIINIEWVQENTALGFPQTNVKFCTLMDFVLSKISQSSQCESQVVITPRGQD